MQELIGEIVITVLWCLAIKKLVNDTADHVSSHYSHAAEDIGHRITNMEWVQRDNCMKTNDILKRIEEELKKLNSEVEGCPLFTYQPLTSGEFNARMHLEARKKKEQGDDI